MRLTPALSVIVVAAAACTSTPPSPPSSPAASSGPGTRTADALARALGDPGDVDVAALRAARDGATSDDERWLLDGALALHAAIERDPRGGAQQLAAFLRAVDARFAREVDVRVEVARAFCAVPSLARSFDVDATALDAEMVARAEKLVADFPNEGRAYGVLAFARGLTGADELAQLRLYGACLARAPEDEGCRRGRDAVVASFEQPRCDGRGARPALALHVARVGRGAGRVVRYGDDDYTLAAVPPVLVAADFTDLRASRPDEYPTIYASTTTAASEKLRAATADAAARDDAAMVLLVGDDVVYAGRVREQIRGGSVAMTSLREPMELTRVCATIERPRVPDELRR